MMLDRLRVGIITKYYASGGQAASDNVRICYSLSSLWCDYIIWAACGAMCAHRRLPVKTAVYALGIDDLICLENVKIWGKSLASLLFHVAVFIIFAATFVVSVTVWYSLHHCTNLCVGDVTSSSFSWRVEEPLQTSPRPRSCAKFAASFEFLSFKKFSIHYLFHLREIKASYQSYQWLQSRQLPNKAKIIENNHLCQCSSNNSTCL